MDLHIGQKLVCVDMRHRPGDGANAYEKMPKEGSVYTVRAIVPADVLYGLDEPGLLLAEIKNCKRNYRCPKGSMFVELCFRCSRFRPVQTTNIEVFLKMLEPVKVREPALT